MLGLRHFLVVLRLPIEQGVDCSVLVPLVLRQRLPDLLALEWQTQLLYLLDQPLLLFCIQCHLLINIILSDKIYHCGVLGFWGFLLALLIVNSASDSGHMEIVLSK